MHSLQPPYFKAKIFKLKLSCLNSNIKIKISNLKYHEHSSTPEDQANNIENIANGEIEVDEPMHDGRIFVEVVG